MIFWSSPLPGDAGRQMRYVNFMGEQKPHLLVNTVNNLGTETRVQYAPSTKFYLRDKRDGKPWITRLPFPVHVVERLETHDHISGNRFVTRYAYHHGYFDGEEREFRGFGMVEQWDTEEFAALSADGNPPEATNVEPPSHVPPMLTRAWFHTGIYTGRNHVSDFFAGLLDERDRGEYYREPAWRADDAEARKHLLPDTILPPGLTLAGRGDRSNRCPDRPLTCSHRVRGPARSETGYGSGTGAEARGRTAGCTGWPRGPCANVARSPAGRLRVTPRCPKRVSFLMPASLSSVPPPTIRIPIESEG